jgi:hypothetical protein
MADHEPPGQPPGNSGGPPGRSAEVYPLYILLFLTVAMAIFIGIAIWAGALTR